MLISGPEQHQRFDELFQRDALESLYDLELSRRPARGVDRIGAHAFERIKLTSCNLLEAKARAGTYVPSPYMEMLVNKGRGKAPRVISIATRRDQLALLQLKQFLHEVFPDRVGRTLPNEHVRRMKGFATTVDLRTYSVLRADIRGFYDNLEHRRLLARINARVLHQPARDLLRRAVRTATVAMGSPSGKQLRNQRGVPQGLAISNILANIYLTDVDAMMSAIAPYYDRYVDDIVALVPTTDVAGVKRRLEEDLSSIGLELNEKTAVVQATNDFDFLSYRFKLPNIGVRRTSVEAFIAKIAALITSYRRAQPPFPSWLTPAVRRNALIAEVNERITGAIDGRRRFGWLFFFQEIEDLSLLHRMDAMISALFGRVPEFNSNPPRQLKRLTRTFYESRYQPAGGYIHNYNDYLTPAQKADFLVSRGRIDPLEIARMTSHQIEFAYDRYRFRQLSRLEKDVGWLS